MYCFSFFVLIVRCYKKKDNNLFYLVEFVLRNLCIIRISIVWFLGNYFNYFLMCFCILVFGRGGVGDWDMWYVTFI